MLADLVLARAGPVQRGDGIAAGGAVAVGTTARNAAERRLLGLAMQLDEPSEDETDGSSNSEETELEANGSSSSSSLDEGVPSPESGSGIGADAADDGEDMETRVAFGILAAETDFPYAAMRE